MSKLENIVIGDLEDLELGIPDVSYLGKATFSIKRSEVLQMELKLDNNELGPRESREITVTGLDAELVTRRQFLGCVDLYLKQNHAILTQANVELPFSLTGEYYVKDDVTDSCH